MSIHLSSLSDRWRGRNIFVTGHSGFVGSWLSVILSRLGANVVGFASSDDATTARRNSWLQEIGVRSVIADVRDREAVSEALADSSADTVVHLAAQPLVKAGYRAPADTMEINILGSVNVLEAARIHMPAALIHVTSDKCYRNKGWPWAYREIDEIGGGCPYSASKVAAEVVFEAYASLLSLEERGVRAASVRFGNVIGGGDYADRVVPNAVRAFRGVESLKLRNDGRAVRPWQHVLDVTAGVLRLGDCLVSNVALHAERLNFAPPSSGDTVYALVRALASEWDQELIYENLEDGLPEDEVVRLDGRHASELLGWDHRFDLLDSARLIREWEMLVATGTSPLDATVGQVDEFLKLIA
jgi:CDP-glucose 4,6-dehydratase